VPRKVRDNRVVRDISLLPIMAGERQQKRAQATPGSAVVLMFAGDFPFAAALPRTDTQSLEGNL
jgi:hypothetical protein